MPSGPSFFLIEVFSLVGMSPYSPIFVRNSDDHCIDSIIVPPRIIAIEYKGCTAPLFIIFIEFGRIYAALGWL